jgi:hypothetical protein
VKLNLRRVGAAPNLGHNTCELSKLCTVIWAWHMVHSCENADTATEQQKAAGSNLGLGRKKNVTCVLGVGVDTGVAWGVIIHIVCTHVRRVVSR